MKNSITKEQNYKINNLRAFAILIVVFGHSIIIFSHDWNLYSTINSSLILDKVKNWINLIQMPLFFSFSGFLFNYLSNEKTNLLKFIKNKCLRLLIPYCCFFWMWLFPIRKLIAYPGFDKPVIDVFINDFLYESDCGHLWFLPCLFCCLIVHYFFCRILVVLRINPVIKIILLFITAFIGYRFFALVKVPLVQNVLLYYIWIVIGHIFSQLQKFSEWLSERMYLKTIIFLVALAVSVYYAIKSDFLFISDNLYLKFCMIVILLYSLYLVFPNKRITILNALSSNSFGVYLIHSPLVYITFAFCADLHPGIIIIINFFAFGSLSYFLTSLIKKTNIRFIIGEKIEFKTSRKTSGSKKK